KSYPKPNPYAKKKPPPPPKACPPAQSTKILHLPPLIPPPPPNNPAVSFCSGRPLGRFLSPRERHSPEWRSYLPPRPGCPRPAVGGCLGLGFLLNFSSL